MAQDVELVQGQRPNACCAELMKKHTKLWEKYSKREVIKNQFRDCATLLQEKLVAIEKENESLKKALEENKFEANVLRDEKEKEAGRRIDLEDEVSALQEEIQLLKHSDKSSSEEADEHFQERFIEAEKEIKQLKELLDQERARAAFEKKNAELEKKKADDEIQLLKQSGKSSSEEADGHFQDRLVVAEKEVKQLKELLDQERASAALEKKNAELEKKKADEEIHLLKQSSKSSSEEADGHFQDRLDVAEKEIKQLKELLDQERATTALEKKNAELEKKKADEALKKVEMGRNKISEAQNVANAERKKAEENKLLCEKLKKETDGMKSILDLERSKFEAAEKKLEAEKQKAVRESRRADLAVAKSEEQRKLAETNLKKATFEKDRADNLTRKLEEATNRAEAAENNVSAEKQKALRERKRADLAVAKSEEQRELAETNLKKAMFEKDRADDLNRKLEEAMKMAEKLQEEIRTHKCSGALVEAQPDEPNTGRNAELTSGVCTGMLKNEAQVPQWMKKMLLKKEHNILKEKKRADLEKKKAKKQMKVAEENKKMAVVQKHRADQLSEELESCKLRFEELQKELQEFISCKFFASNAPSRNSEFTFETDTVKVLKKQLELERLLVKHAQKATKLEASRNKILHRELCHLKQEYLQLQQRMDILDKSFLLGHEGIDQLEKIGNQTSKEMLCLDGLHSQLISGTDSKMDPPYGGSNRKMLQSSAINSSSASFSDRPLVGSQERGTFSVMTSGSNGEDISNFEPTMVRLSDTMRMYNELDVAKGDKTMRSPIKDDINKRKVGYREKRRVLDAVESIGNFYSKGQKLHQRVLDKLSVLQGILNKQSVDLKDENLKETSCKELSRPCKKRKTSSDGTLAIHHPQGSSEPECVLDSSIGRLNASMPASPGSDTTELELPGLLTDGAKNICGRSHCMRVFDEMVTCDYMKLLDLDNSADENSYLRAIAMPLSPTLPELEFHAYKESEVNNSEMLVRMNFQEGLSTVRENPASVSGFNVIQSEKNFTTSISDTLVPSQLQAGEGSIDFSKNMDPLSVSHTPCRRIHVSGGKLGMPDLSGSGNEETSLLCENRTGSFHAGLLKFFVVSSQNKENPSISRILEAIGNCIPQSSFIHSPIMFLQSILGTLLKAEDLSIKEKACVFFSLMLHEVSEVEVKSLKNVWGDDSVQNLGSVYMHITAAFSDPAFRRIFMESCDLFELLAVIEDFLLQRTVLVCGEVSADFTFKLNLTLNGNGVMLSEVVASADLLVVGASILASLCSAIDHIGLVCEISVDIIRMQNSDHAVMLAVLHSFARICGSKYLSLEQYSLAMTAVKSLVIFLEKKVSSSEGKSPSKTWSCSNCPFSYGGKSMEDVALLLLENLQKQCHSEPCSQDSLALVNFLVPSVRSHREGTEKVSCSRHSVPSSSNLCDFIDILSLVEVLSSFMSWNWTYDHFIRRICEYLESHLMEGSSAAIIILLGQLGRLGVDTNGYEDSEVNKLKGWLSAFLCETTFMKLSLSIQFAIITSLFSLTPIKLEDIIEGKVGTPAVTSRSIPASFIKQWFFSLSDEQKSFLRLHRAPSESNY